MNYIDGKNLLDESIEVIIGIVNKSVYLPCRLQTIPKNLFNFNSNVIWRRKKDKQYLTFQHRLLTTDKRFSLKIYRLNNVLMDLKIDKLKLSDEGEYECLYSTEKITDRKVVKLKIFVPTIILEKGSSQQHIIVKESNNVSIKCNAYGIPTPNISWFAHWNNGLTMKLINTMHNILIKSKSILIINVTRNHDGIYTCLADNNVNSKQFKKYTIDVWYEPVIIMGNDIIEQEKDHRTIVSALISGHPITTIQWEKNYQLLEIKEDKCIQKDSVKKLCFIIEKTDKHKEQKAQLWIYNLTFTDFGIYRCIVSSPFGRIYGITKLIEFKQVNHDSWDQYISITNEYKDSLKKQDKKKIIKTEWQEEKIFNKLTTSNSTIKFLEIKDFKKNRNESKIHRDDFYLLIFVSMINVINKLS